MTTLDGLIAASATALLAIPAAMMLDDVLFSGPEVPASIKVGGTQGLVTHRLPGGQRVMDLMGPDESAIQWTGLLVGPGASAKAMLLSSMRRAGGVRQLSFGDIVVGVVITRFEYAYQSQGLLIPYLLRAEVAPVSSPSTGFDQISTAPVLADIGSATASIGAGLQMMSAYAGVTTPASSQGLATLAGNLEIADADLTGLPVSTSAPSDTALLSVRQALEACLASPAMAASTNLDAIGSASGFVSTLLACSVGAAAASARGYVARAYVNSP